MYSRRFPSFYSLLLVFTFSGRSVCSLFLLTIISLCLLFSFRCISSLLFLLLCSLSALICFPSLLVLRPIWVFLLLVVFSHHKPIQVALYHFSNIIGKFYLRYVTILPYCHILNLAHQSHLGTIANKVVCYTNIVALDITLMDISIHLK